MKDFSRVSFRGKFRDYQQNVLDGADKHLKDGKIHIVAAPGSGKTVLGLELIRRMGNPVLVLSPTVVIRSQWCERFAEMFLADGESAEDYLSFTLKKPGLITSITYQALYAAVTGCATADAGEDEETVSTSQEDYSGFSITRCIQEAGIKTVCLDEAHHLRSEWEKTLETVVSQMGAGITLISLTATPPYDCTPSEWDRYISLCGEIDEEIFVPQLVAQKSLCPHQDYVYFSYPTDQETELLHSHREKALLFTEEFVSGQLFNDLLEASGLLSDYRVHEEFILDNPEGIAALLSLAQHSGFPIPDKQKRLLFPRGLFLRAPLPRYSLDTAQTALQFLLDHPERFPQDAVNGLRRELLRQGLLQRKKVTLVSDDKLNRLLFSSVGKLRGIVEIVRAESFSMGEKLRLLILTDYIRRDMANLIDTDAPIMAMGAVPVFEAVRRACGSFIHPALLSGTLVILPDDALSRTEEIARTLGFSLRVKPLCAGYSELILGSSNRDKVALLSEVFRRGIIKILIGTKSLLGEGWDLPCINSLILASFVDSFVSSNQMRGRAIRTVPGDPDKTSNIWHLVTLEKPYPNENPAIRLLSSAYDMEQEKSADYEGLVRRIDCFLGPAYHADRIESGIDRLDIIHPPFLPESVDSMNRQMLELAADRAGMARRWNSSQGSIALPEILHTQELPLSVRPVEFLYRTAASELLLVVLEVGTIQLSLASIASGSVFPWLAGLAAFSAFAVMLVRRLHYLLRFLSPKRAIKTLCGCVLNTLLAMKEIESQDCRLLVESDPSSKTVLCALTGATAREKSVFAQAVRELLSPIDNPRYILIKRYLPLGRASSSYTQSYACPSVIGVKKESAEIFASWLTKSAGSFELLYTRSEAGRRELLKCRKWSYLNEAVVKMKKVVRKE